MIKDFLPYGPPLFVSSLLFNIMVFRCIGIVFECKPVKNRLLYILCIVVSAAVPLTTLMSFQSLPGIIKLILGLGVFLFPALCYSAAFRQLSLRMFYVGAAVFAVTENGNNILRKVIPSDKERIRNIVVYLILAVALAVTLAVMNRKNWVPVIKSGIKLVSRKMYVVILIYLMLMSIFFKFVMTHGQEYKASFMAVPVIFMWIFIIARIMKISASERAQKESTALLENQFNDYVEHCKDIVRLNDEMRSFRHDMKNHLMCIDSFIEGNETERAIEYIRNIEGMTASVRKKYDTGNFIADSLLSKKCEKAKEINTKIVFDGIVPTNGIANVDLCIIMANAVDNAIEACAKDTSGEEKIININSNFRQGYFFLKITNPVFDKVEIKNGNKVRTSKRDTALHGFGVANIVKTVNKYGGTTDLSAENGTFTLNVSLQLKNNN